jgi:XapX domain-containing protein
MHAAIGLVLAFAIGVACRWSGVPIPAPPRLLGALLVLATTLGYVCADRFLAPPARGDDVAASPRTD